MRWWIGLLVAVALAACTFERPRDVGEEDASPVDDVTPPEVVSTTPAADSADVGTSTTIVIEFSEPIDPSTVSGATVRIEDVDGTVAIGELSVDGSTASFSHVARLDPNVSYVVELTDEIADAAGNRLVEPYTFSFETSGGWASPALVEQDSATTVREIDAAMTAGHGVVAWVTQGCSGACNGDYALFASVYEDGAFGTPMLIVNAGATTLPDPRVAIDPMGNATVVWAQRIGSYSSLYASRRPSGGSWTAPALIETEEAGNVGAISLGTDSSGNVFAVWVQSDATTSNAWVNRYAVPGGWTGATRLEVVASAASDPVVSVAEDGTATALWSHGSYISYSRFATSWTAAATAVSGHLGNASAARVLDDGTVVLVWHEDDVWASHYIGGWAIPSTIETSGDPAYAQDAKLTPLPGGDAIAVWTQGTLSQESVYYSRFVSGTWSGAELISPL